VPILIETNTFSRADGGDTVQRLEFVTPIDNTLRIPDTDPRNLTASECGIKISELSSWFRLQNADWILIRILNVDPDPAGNISKIFAIFVSVP